MDVVADTSTSTTYNYFYAGGKLIRQTDGTNTLDFFYDESGHPYAVTHSIGENSTTYYYVTNLQGDVLAILDSSKQVVASYTYDPYGKVLSATGTLAEINPLRYRGYVYDSDTGFYYLQSRYYDPTIGRFINADDTAYLGLGGIASYNLFSYCENNPVMGYDPTGCWDWGLFLDIVVTLVTTVIAVGVGIAVGTATYSATGSVKTAAEASVTVGTVTFGSINNTVNAVYYNYVSDSKSEIETDPDHSTYVDEYVPRWDRLDYTKQETGEECYNLNAWRYHSEYSLHMYGWYATGWAKDTAPSLFASVADSCYSAAVDPQAWDTRPHIKVGTIFWGMLGL